MKRRNLFLMICVFLFLTCFGTACSLGGKEDGAQDGGVISYDYYGNHTCDFNETTMQLTLFENGEYELTSEGIAISTFDVFGVNLVETGKYQAAQVNMDEDGYTILCVFAFSDARCSGFYNDEVVNASFGYLSSYLLDGSVFGLLQKDSGEQSVFWGYDESVYLLKKVPKTYTLTYKASMGGDVQGNLKQTFTDSTATGSEVTAVAQEGYIFKEWSDGLQTPTRIDKVGGVNKMYTAYFVPLFEVACYAMEGGTLSMNGEINKTFIQKVALGGSIFSVSAVADEGYIFAGWARDLNGTDWLGHMGAIEYTFAEGEYYVPESFAYYAIFRLVEYTYTVEINQGINNEVVLSSPVANVLNGYTVQATAVPSSAWVFCGWSDGVKDATRTDVLTQDFYVEAIFAKKITIIATEGGKVTDANGNSAERLEIGVLDENDGDTIAYAVAEAGYEFCGWSYDEAGSFICCYISELSADYYSGKTVYYAIFRKK